MTREGDVSRPQGAAYPLTRGRSGVARVVEPPDPVITVEVVIRVAWSDTDGSVFIFQYFHDVRLFG